MKDIRYPEQLPDYRPSSSSSLALQPGLGSSLLHTEGFVTMTIDLSEKKYLDDH
jgi:hypothetical protein